MIINNIKYTLGNLQKDASNKNKRERSEQKIVKQKSVKEIREVTVGCSRKDKIKKEDRPISQEH